MTTKPRRSKADIAAMTRAIGTVRSWGSEYDAQITEKITEDSWDVAGRFCAIWAQGRKLQCKPWQICPAGLRDIDAALAEPPDDYRGLHNAALLLQRMLAAGVSKFDPDPIAALEAAEARVP